MENLIKALIEAQKEIPTLPKNAKGHNYKYCKLDTIIEVVKPILLKHGILTVQHVKTILMGDKIVTGIQTELIHSGGEKMDSFFEMPHATLRGGSEAQEQGAAITYARRYALGSTLNIATDEDVDARPLINKTAQANPVYDEVVAVAKKKFKGSSELGAWMHNNKYTKNLKQMSEKELSALLDVLNEMENV